MEEIIEIPFGAFDSELKGWEHTIPEGMEARIEGNKVIFESKESEDERIRREIISFIQDDIDEINLKVSGDYDDRDADDIAHQKWCEKCIAWLEKQGEKNHNPYSGVSFAYNGHTWGMCARDNGIEILIDGQLKGRVFAEDVNTIAKEMFIKALERVEELSAKGYKLTDCDKNSWWEDFKAYRGYSEQNLANSEKTCKEEYIRFAKHFFELGVKARQG